MDYRIGSIIELYVHSPIAFRDTTCLVVPIVEQKSRERRRVITNPCAAEASGWWLVQSGLAKRQET